MSGRSPTVVPLSLEVMRRTIGPDVEAARGAVKAWLNDGPTPDFDAIASLVVPAIETLLERAWIRVNDQWEHRVSSALEILEDPSDLRWRGRVTELLELVYWALSEKRPPLPPR